MSRTSKRKSQPATRWPKLLLPAALLVIVAGVVLAVKSNKTAGAAKAKPLPAAPTAPIATASNPAPAESTMEVAKAVMVTVELDFGPQVPSIAEALQHIERRSVPDDGKGRTFAILDAYGEPTPAGKLHISMHVSSEKPGRAALIFKRTGEILWQSRIVPSTNAAPFSGKDLKILIDDGAGKTLMIDGSKNPSTILDAGLRDTPLLVRDNWPDGVEREFTFIYSACGCPVKAMVRRTGERTVRTKEMPVMFPDDPAVMRVIARLMGW